MMTRSTWQSERELSEIEERAADRRAERISQCCDKRCPSPEDHYYNTNAKSTIR